VRRIIFIIGFALGHRLSDVFVLQLATPLERTREMAEPHSPLYELGHSAAFLPCSLVFVSLHMYFRHLLQ
jgi:hypothetical protein